MVRTTFNNAESIIAVSNTVARELTDNFGIKSEKIAVLYNPIDITLIQKKANEPISKTVWFDEDVPIILYVGRLVFYKGLHYLLKAISIVKKSKRVRCIIIGDGDDKITLQRLALDLGISAEVAFLGKTENPFKFMKRADIFVLPSFTEGFQWF